MTEIQEKLTDAQMHSICVEFVKVVLNNMLALHLHHAQHPKALNLLGEALRKMYCYPASKEAIAYNRTIDAFAAGRVLLWVNTDGLRLQFMPEQFEAVWQKAPEERRLMESPFRLFVPVEVAKDYEAFVSSLATVLN